MNKKDSEFNKLLLKERKRQQDCLSMIASENFFSPAVRSAAGSIFAHKYSEGNIGARYYEGNEHVDALETLTIERAKKVFKTPSNWEVNVQALSGSSANLAVYLSVLNIGDTLMGMYLPDGGHLSHGWSYEPSKKINPQQLTYEGGSRKVNITSKIFKTIQYKTDPKTRLLNYSAIERIAKKYKPKLIITGGTAYPREINYRRVKAIAKKVGALYLADIAHEAGLVAGEAVKSPVGIADIVTMTTHKTLRAGRGAIILAHKDLMNRINRAILPGLQGGPHNHNIASICVGLGEALSPEYKRYAKQIVINAQYLGDLLKQHGFNLVSGGTDKHLILIDLTSKPLQGKKFARALSCAGIVTNFNTMPQETKSPANPSALRMGTAWITTRGMKKREIKKIPAWMNRVMIEASKFSALDFNDYEKEIKKSHEIKNIAMEIKTLCHKFPLDF